MKKPRLRTLTIIFGVLVALSAIAVGTTLTQKRKVAELNNPSELPAVDFIDLNKVFYTFFHK